MWAQQKREETRLDKPIGRNSMLLKEVPLRTTQTEVSVPQKTDMSIALLNIRYHEDSKTQ